MICLSFDTDHMSEIRMAEFLNQVEIPGAATFFCTQHYNCLDGLAHELAPHPFLGERQDWGEELRQKREMFPQAKGWRSHSCTFSHILAKDVAAAGYDYVSTHDSFGSDNIIPIRHCWGVWHLPIYYMDNLDFSARRFWEAKMGEPFESSLIERAVGGDALYVFDFHPIHILMNTPDADFYLERREAFLAGVATEELRFEGRGSHVFFEELVGAMNEGGVESVRMSDALSDWQASTSS